ncbi:8390_t:CDS:1, partial [Racocetra persica]
QHHIKNHALYRKGFGLIKKALNIAVKTGCTEELYELYQQFIEGIENQLEKQKEHAIQPD